MLLIRIIKIIYFGPTLFLTFLLHSWWIVSAISDLFRFDCKSKFRLLVSIVIAAICELIVLYFILTNGY